MNIKYYIGVGVIFVYCLALLTATDATLESLMLSSLILIALFGWVYPIALALLFSALILCISQLIAVELPHHIPLKFSPITPSTLGNVSIIVSILTLCVVTNILKSSQNKLRSLKASLESEITRRTTELNSLTLTLIDQDESERVRMGQDLHDGVGQYLTGMLLFNEALKEKLVRIGKMKEASMVAMTTGMIQKNMKYISRLARTLFPVKIDDTGLEQALYEMTSYFTETSQIQFEVKIELNCAALSQKTTLHIYRVIHEAVQNALTHGRATQIGIALSEEDDHTCLLKVWNNGKLLSADFKEGMGHKLMTYRMKSIRGTLSLNNDPTNNTVLLQCTLPL